MQRIELLFRSAVVSAAALVAGVVQAQGLQAPPSGVLNITASAVLEVAQDMLGVTFSVTREGADAATVQSGLKQALDVALAEARRAARPGQLEVQTGAFSLVPRYAPKGGAISGWHGSAELSVEGKDVAAIAQLTGRIQTMTISRVGYTLSREAREKVEADVAAQAIARYRAQAAAMSQQFGYAGYTVREVSVASHEPPPYGVQPMMRSATLALSGAESLPTEAGKAKVGVTVSGSVQMVR